MHSCLHQLFNNHRRNQMTRMTSGIVTSAAFVAAFAVSSAFAQAPEPVRGTVASADGSSVTVKTDKGDVKVGLTDKTVVMTVGKATIADIKPNSFVGVGATPQADGSQKAIRVMIFPEAQRGTNEGHYPWTGAGSRPGTTMTNATVDTTVSSVDGQVVTVKYKDGEKKIIVGPDANILSNIPGSKADLKPGARVFIAATTKKPDGTLETARVNVARGDFQL
jgi:hypothetical protein